MTWAKSVIREARKAELAPLLSARGYRLLPLDNGNYRILPDPGVTPPPPALSAAPSHPWRAVAPWRRRLPPSTLHLSSRSVRPDPVEERRVRGSDIRDVG